MTSDRSPLKMCVEQELALLVMDGGEGADSSRHAESSGEEGQVQGRQQTVSEHPLPTQSLHLYPDVFDTPPQATNGMDSSTTHLQKNRKTGLYSTETIETGQLQKT